MLGQVGQHCVNTGHTGLALCQQRPHWASTGGNLGLTLVLAINKESVDVPEAIELRSQNTVRVFCVRLLTGLFHWPGKCQSDRSDTLLPDTLTLHL